MCARCQTHLLLHQCPDRKAVDLQDPVPLVDGISHLWTNKHPSDSGTTQHQHLYVSISTSEGPEVKENRVALLHHMNPQRPFS